MVDTFSKIRGSIGSYPDRLWIMIDPWDSLMSDEYHMLGYRKDGTSSI